ncbi:hypothetical protein C8J56DRAFT_822391 [Mycena floridula]|nr:hypothetical protein C8J56DRAFT_822391 [Mycena floridula]
MLLALATFERNAPDDDMLPQNEASIEPSLPTEIPGLWPMITMDAETDQLLNILSDTSSWYEPGDQWYNPTNDTMSVFPPSSESPTAPSLGEWTDPKQSMHVSSCYPSLDNF